MKRLLLTLLCLGVSIAGLVPRALAESSDEVIISPEAQAVVDRVRDAYSRVAGWTATLVRETRATINGREEVRVLRETEHYLPNPAGPAYYMVSTRFTEKMSMVSGQNPAERYQLARTGDGPLEAKLAAPDEAVRPRLWAELESRLAGARYVNYNGRDTVGGESCDVIECFDVITRPATPERPNGISIVHTLTSYVNQAGFIVQQRIVMNGGSIWAVVRFAFDAQTPLTAADFSREAFDRAAATLLRNGEAMPVLVPTLFKPGQRLPDQRFIAWEDNKPFRLSDLEGKIVVVETWASWCYSCKIAFPFYEKMRRQLAAQDVVFVAVSFDAKPADYEKWMNAHAKEYGFKFGLVDAADAKAAMKTFKGLLPAFYVIGRDGRILSAYSGFGYDAGAEDPRLLKALREAGVKLDDVAAESSPAK